MSHSVFRSRFSVRKLGVAALAAVVLSVGSAVAQQASPTQAGLQSYDVELLIFRNLSGKETPENWGIESGSAEQRLAIPDDETGAVEAPAPSAPTASFPSLPASKMKLSGIAETLRRGRAYQPLAHFGWTQPGYARNTAKYISLDSLAPPSSGLQGRVALSRGRYLHLTLDLAYDGASATGESTQRYVLRQTRRMRSNERHYIDSPKFGVIAVITPSAEGG